MPLFRGTGGSGESSTNAYASEIAQEARTASSKANEAATSAASALAAQTAAEAAQAAAETAQANAETAETNAETAETNAETAENAAVAAKTSATTAKTAAETAQSAAEVAKTAAETAETNAETAETNASTSATTATTKAGEAATSATNAASSASSASTSATNAATSATAAQTAQTAAEAAQTAAEAAQEAIDGLYLGTATSNPTVDLNGDAVTVGDWYFNTTDNTTRIYDGSNWNTINPDLVGDTTPQLGGNLDLNSNDITGTGNVNITGNVVLSGTVDGRDVAADGTKLDGIEASATADQTAAEIRTLVESASDSNVFTDADHTKLNGIEANATADQTAAEIRTLVGSASDSNVFTDADHSKLDGIEASADVTDTANVTAAGALMDSELTSEASVKALNQGVATTDSPTFDGLTIDSSDVTLATIQRDGGGSPSFFGGYNIKFNAANSTLGDDYYLGINVGGQFSLSTHSGFLSSIFDITSTGIDVNGTVEFNGLSGTGSVTVTDILDQDDMSSNSATALATQQSIKAYVDTTVAATNELVEDTTPQLGGDLDLNSNDITGTGNINITGDTTLTGNKSVKLPRDGSGFVDRGIKFHDTLGGTEILADSSDNITIKSVGHVVVNANDGEIKIKDGGNAFAGQIDLANDNNVTVSALIANKDIIFKGNDHDGISGVSITALTLDMSDAGKALFNAGADFGADISVTGTVAATNVTSNGNNVLTTSSTIDGGTY